MGLNTLGVSVGDGWAYVIAALGDPDGGLTPATVSQDPSGNPKTGHPRDAVMDPPNVVSAIINTIFSIGAPEVNGEIPSEFTRPWKFPLRDNQGNPVNVELPRTSPGPFAAGMDANALFGAMPGTKHARDVLEASPDERTTIRLVNELLRTREHQGPGPRLERTGRIGRRLRPVQSRCRRQDPLHSS